MADGEGELRGGRGVKESGISVREARAEDRPAILDLCREALGWDPDDPNEAFFRWKHDENAFGPSPMWVAEDSEGIVGVRCFMRWRFTEGSGTTWDAVRAVDTATHPRARGKGIFRTLTLGALPQLTEAGTGFVFNTPNEQSRPGYLKMGWSTVGQVPLGLLPTGPGVLKRAGGWSGADKWGVPSDVGSSPEEAFADTEALQHLLWRRMPTQRIRTDLDVDVLRWRYGFPQLGYRVEMVNDRLEDGAVVFRLRRRGGRLDAVICEELLPNPKLVEPLYRRLARQTGADLLLRTQSPVVGRGPFVRVRRLGPLLVWRPLSRDGVPTLADLDLSYGDLELF